MSIAFERGSDIWVFNLNDRRQGRVVRNGRSPSWSPDDRKLAFTRGPFYSDAPDGLPDLWVLDVVGKKERRLARNGDAANWSPDGRRIVFMRCRSDPTFECFVYVARADGTAERRLFKGEVPVWSPNGQEVAFLYYDAIMRARLDGSRRRTLFGQRPYCGCGSVDWGRAPRLRR